MQSRTATCGTAGWLSYSSTGYLKKIIRYEDDDDFEAREAWNIAKHDKESTSVAWSTVYSKINIAKKTYAKVQEWAAASVRLRHCIGSGANYNATIGRWVRAAQRIDGAVLAEIQNMKWLRGRSIWANPYFLHVTTNARAKMKPESAIKALKLLQADAAMPCAALTEKICMPVKVLEVWCALMAKRFGSVCTGSAAFHRLVSSLETRAGLQSVLACAKANIMLHDAGGNPDCVLLVAEFSRCQAGGLPPPACLPLVTEEDKKKAAVEATQKEEVAVAERARANEESKSMELELFAMTTMQSTSVPGVSAGTEMASDTLAADMSRVHFQETATQLIKASKGVVESSSRTTVVLDVASSSIFSLENLHGRSLKNLGKLRAGCGLCRRSSDAVPPCHLMRPWQA